MEWLFFITKPSFLSGNNFFSSLVVLFATALPFAVSAAALALIFRQFIPALIATLTAIILLDNFTYTVFQWGIIHTKGFLRLAYGFAALAALGGFFVYFRKHLFSSTRGLYLGLLVISCLCIFLRAGEWAYLSFQHADKKQASAKAYAENLPNIIFFASDGLNADHFSSYGYGRDTTPALNKLIRDRPPLFVENAISNAGRTTGSLTSMLNSKLPVHTKVFFPPHILQGQDSHEHLPGILKTLGYTNFQESTRYFADALDVGMLNSFDIVNQRVSKIYLPPLLAQTIANETFFIAAMLGRIQERWLHLINSKPMQDHYAQVVSTERKELPYGSSDAQRMERTLEFIKGTKEPFFIHLHLMNSHCCHFYPDVRKFSRPEDIQTRKNRNDFYDDVILTSDQYFGQMIDFLKTNNKLSNSIIVYSSDHNHHWSVRRRVPLMFFFPNSEHSDKQVSANAQLLDVAPTILDYLHYPAPAWMQGQSLLQPEAIDPKRPIFAVNEVDRTRIQFRGRRVSALGDSKPPLYGLRIYNYFVCNQWYELDLVSGKTRRGFIRNHTAPCNMEVDKEAAKKIMLQHLRQYGITPPR